METATIDTQGSVVEMSEMTCGGQNVLAFVTTKGHLCGLDLRIPNLAWDLENDPRHGKSFCKISLTH